MDTIIKKNVEVAGRILSIETGHLAKQAGGAVLVRYGDTVVLVTATSKEPREGIDFFPLTVDYEEKMYAVGKIPGGFLRREGKATEQATLACRLIDRPIRPLFPDGYRDDVQIVATVLSVDQDNTPEVAAMIGASAALHLSNIPFLGPIAGIRVGLIDEKLILNPTEDETEKSKLDLTIAGTKEAIMMVEASADEVSESIVLDAIMKGHEVIGTIVDVIEDLRHDALTHGIAKEKEEASKVAINDEIYRSIKSAGENKLSEALRIVDKLKRDEAIKYAKNEIAEELKVDHPENATEIDVALDDLVKEIVRNLIINENIRPDGRKLDEVRQITCEVDLLPRVHGSAVFTRGQTQILSATTLGSLRDNQFLDGIDVEDYRRYLHHYNFPPYSVGETRPIRGPGRREIGHGALARRALEPVIPTEEEFPYTIRVVSEALESNGSTSMGSVCGSTLSLMAAGVPIKKPVSGIAMGLIKNDEKFVVLSDLQGLEDALGDMDFKVAGTEDGITAIQMDIKIPGINREILNQALKQAKEGRLFILNKMLNVINQPREELSPFAPRVITLEIDPEKIRDVIGSGGKVIRKITEDTETEINIEDDGTIHILSNDQEKGAMAQHMIESIIKEPEVGEIYTGTVVRLMDFGAFVNILPGKDGLIHISQLAHHHVKKVDDVLKVGDEVKVKVIEIDKQGRINLSRKALLPKPQTDDNRSNEK